MSDLEEARQLNRRYRKALERIVNGYGIDSQPWCPMYAECDHEGCKSSHAHIEIATSALDVETYLGVRL